MGRGFAADGCNDDSAPETETEWCATNAAGMRAELARKFRREKKCELFFIIIRSPMLLDSVIAARIASEKTDAKEAFCRQPKKHAPASILRRRFFMQLHLLFVCFFLLCLCRDWISFVGK